MQLPSDGSRPKLVIESEPLQVLRAPLVECVIGMGHMLPLVRGEPGTLRPNDAAKRLQQPDADLDLPAGRITSSPPGRV